MNQVKGVSPSSLFPSSSVSSRQQDQQEKEEENDQVVAGGCIKRRNSVQAAVHSKSLKASPSLSSVSLPAPPSSSSSSSKNKKNKRRNKIEINQMIGRPFQDRRLNNMNTNKYGK